MDSELTRDSIGRVSTGVLGFPRCLQVYPEVNQVSLGHFVPDCPKVMLESCKRYQWTQN